MGARTSYKKYMSFAIKIILGITFGILLYQCVLLSWEISLSKQIENNSLEMLQKSYVSKSEDGMVKIYWAVNGMKQDDPILIEFIRENVLVKPSYTSTKGLFININVSIISFLVFDFGHSWLRRYKNTKVFHNLCLHFARQDEEDGKKGKKITQLN